MTHIPIRPMLAVSAAGVEAWPAEGFWVQPKFDGIRVLIEPEIDPVLRSGEPVPNPIIREALSHPALIGMDGEVTAPGGLEAAQSAVMGSARAVAWSFHAVDDVTAYSSPFSARLKRLHTRSANLPAFASVSPARLALTAGEAPDVYSAVLADHAALQPHVALDGLILRSPSCSYREGKASARRGELLKVKPCNEGEARILDIRARDDDGHALGAVQLESGDQALWAPVAMPRALARALWRDRGALPGRMMTVRWWGRTRTGLPRHAVAVALRRDLKPQEAIRLSAH